VKSSRARRVPDYLQHILDAIDRATSYVSGMDLKTFEQDTRTQDAVIRSIEIVGEAANKTRLADPEFAARFPSVPWALMYGMRNRIVHDYFEVDLEIVWQTVQHDLPVLHRQISGLLKHAGENQDLPD
jgi:uncharacterized protein with HEPN domain